MTLLKYVFLRQCILRVLLFILQGVTNNLLCQLSSLSVGMLILHTFLQGILQLKYSTLLITSYKDVTIVFNF